jgi:hypothetical protein
MIDYKYPTIASRATPVGSTGRAPDEDLLWEDHQWRARKKISSPLSVASTRNKLDISLPSGERIQEPKDFRKSKNWIQKLKKWKFSRIWSLMKSKIEEVEELKKSKIEEVKDWRS